jgi:hypothetical protein
MRRIFGPNREKLTGEWRILHSKTSRNLYSSLDIIRVRHKGRRDVVFTKVEMGNAYKIIIRKPERTRRLGMHKHTREDNTRIKVGLKDRECDRVGWIQQAQGKVQWWALVKKPLDFIIGLEFSNG